MGLRSIHLSGDLDFGTATLGSGSVSRTLQIDNGGSSLLTWTGIDVYPDDGSHLPDFFTFSPTSGTVEPGGADVYTDVVFTWYPEVGDETGSFSGLVTVTSDDNFYPTKSIAWSATAVEP